MTIKEKSLHPSDEAWLVIDKDNWIEDHLTILFEWSKENENYGLAISNPKFEYWLLLHFEDGYGVSNGKECTTRLKKHIPEYDKSLDPRRRITKEMIEKALERARKKDTPRCEKWPTRIGTTIYRLVERIFDN